MSVFLLSSFLSVSHIYADGGTFENPTVFKSFQDLLNGFAHLVIIIGIPTVALAFVYAGFLFIIAQGKPTALDKAKYNAIGALVGAVLLLGFGAITTLLSHTASQIMS